MVDRPTHFAPDQHPMLTHDPQHGYQGEDAAIQVAMKTATFERYLRGYVKETYGVFPTAEQWQSARLHVTRVRYWHDCADPCNVFIAKKGVPSYAVVGHE